MEYYTLLLPLALILLLSKSVGVGFRKVGVPQVIGMILAGLVVGCIGFIPKQQVLTQPVLEGLSFLAKIGVVIIMFSAGLDTDLAKVKQTGGAAVVITVLGVVVPMGLGFAVAGAFLGFNNILSCLFYGVILTATSVSVTVACLKELGKLDSKVGTAIISAAIIDDIIGIVLLSLITGLSGSGEGGDPVWLVLVKTVGFFAAAIGVGFVIRWLFKRLGFHHHHFRRIAIFAFALCFFYAYAAERWFGVADITGAYIAGIMLSGLSDTDYIDRKADISTYLLFGPVFFANIGVTTMMQIVGGDFHVDGTFIAFGVVFVVVGLLGKLIGCGVGAKLCRFDWKDSLRVGLGMMVRAEVVLICTQKGIQAGLVDSAIMPFVLAIILVSSFVTPLLLKLTYRKEYIPQEPADLPETTGE
ncbi:MAG: cation:proton antiporter [Clostridia bacterium]|nr:cation:proton antiporter [Clostridia bacterium]